MWGYVMHEILNFSSTPIPDTGAWVLKNGFFIKKRGWGFDIFSALSKLVT